MHVKEEHDNQSIQVDVDRLLLDYNNLNWFKQFFFPTELARALTVYEANKTNKNAIDIYYYFTSFKPQDGNEPRRLFRGTKSWWPSILTRIFDCLRTFQRSDSVTLFDEMADFNQMFKDPNNKHKPKNIKIFEAINSLLNKSPVDRENFFNKVNPLTHGEERRNAAYLIQEIQDLNEGSEPTHTSMSQKTKDRRPPPINILNSSAPAGQFFPSTPPIFHDGAEMKAEISRHNKQ